MGLLKVFHFNSALISEKDVETLYEMIKDTDSLVVYNTLLVLNEILKKEDGGIAINNKMIIYLLNRIRVIYIINNYRILMIGVNQLYLNLYHVLLLKMKPNYLIYLIY